MEGGDGQEDAIGPQTPCEARVWGGHRPLALAPTAGHPPRLSPQQAKFALYRSALRLRWRLPHTLFCTLAWEQGLSARHFLWTCLVRGLGRGDRLPLEVGGGRAGDARARLQQVRCGPRAGRGGAGRGGVAVPPPRHCPPAR